VLILIRPTTVEVRDSTACPKCGAVIGEECFDGAASRDANHIERRRVAIQSHLKLMDDAMAAYREAADR
jgi:hypothetical protein